MAYYIANSDDFVRGEPAYRIDATSNYNNESYAEMVMLTFLTKSQAERIADIMNEGLAESVTFYAPRLHGSPLWRGMEELI